MPASLDHPAVRKNDKSAISGAEVILLAIGQPLLYSLTPKFSSTFTLFQPLPSSPGSIEVT